jgi:hypothetical protein
MINLVVGIAMATIWIVGVVSLLILVNEARR